MALQDHGPIPIAEPPREITFYSSRKVWLPRALGSLAVTASGFYMAVNGFWTGWAAFALFGVCTFVFARMLFLPQASSLRLTDKGFHVRAMFRNQFVQWQDISVFSLISIGGKTIVEYLFHTVLRTGN